MLALTSSIETPYHRIRAGHKLALLMVITLGVMQITRLDVMLGVVATIFAVYAVGGLGFIREGLRAMRPLVYFIVILLAWHGYAQTLPQGLLVIARLVAAVALANLVTLTTRLEDMIDTVMWLLSPLRKIGLDPEVFALAFALVVRFTAVFMEKARGLDAAWRARSARGARWSVILPLVSTALDDAEHVADALSARSVMRDD